MSKTTKPAPAADAAAQASTLTQKISRWVTIAAGIIIGLIGLLKVYNYMVPQMPACADSNTAVIRDIVKKKDVALTQLSDLKLDTETKSERNCLAHIETASETGTIAYRITMQGKEFQVMITKVDAKPR